MSHRPHVLRRALLGLTTTAVLAGGALPAAPSYAAEPHPRARAAAGWLTTQLNDGLVHNRQFDFDDIGLTLDVHLALHQLDVRQAARERILAAVEPHAGVYTGTAAGDAYAGQLGKLLTVLELEQVAPRSYGAGGLVRALAGTVVRTGPQAGRAVDDSEFGNFTQTIGQALVVRGLALGERRLTGLTTRFLLKQQCDAGYFREGMESSDFTCETGRAEGVAEPYVDATAFAVTALRAAGAAGVGGLRDDIRDALRWLRDHQRTNGSFVGNGVPNANSTGLAAAVLADSRYERAAGRAAAWLARRQATRANAAGTPLRRDLGAVAYDRAAFARGVDEGITVTTRDQWRRATAQAAPGLDALPG